MSRAETLTHPAVRGKESRGWGTARDQDEGRLLKDGLISAGAGAVRRVQSPLTPSLALLWRLAILGGGCRSPGHTRGEGNKRHESTGSTGRAVQGGLCNTSKPPTNGVPFLRPRDLHQGVLHCCAHITKGPARDSGFSQFVS